MPGASVIRLNFFFLSLGCSPVAICPHLLLVGKAGEGGSERFLKAICSQWQLRAAAADVLEAVQ